MFSNTKRASPARVVAIAAAAAMCGAAAVAVVVHARSLHASSLLELAPLEPVARLSPRMQQRALANALHDDMNTRRGAQMLTVSPDVAEWMYNNENGDDTFGGPDGEESNPQRFKMWQEEEPCATVMCQKKKIYTARKHTPKSWGGGHAHTHTATKTGGMLARGLARTHTRTHTLSTAGGGRLEALGEISDFPDIDEYVPTKDAAAQVDDIYDRFQPVEDQLQKISPEEKTEYADFYRAYAAYQLPHEISNRGPGHAWSPEMQGLGSDLPPNLYPYSPEYYPNPGIKNVAVTINANGDGSTNSFQVSGPQQINVNVGAQSAQGEEDAGGYIYPDGKTAVTMSPSAPSPEYQPLGLANVPGHEAEFKAAGVDRESWGTSEAPAEGCDASNPDCNFFQDAYDDAFWR